MALTGGVMDFISRYVEGKNPVASVKQQAQEAIARAVDANLKSTARAKNPDNEISVKGVFGLATTMTSASKGITMLRDSTAKGFLRIEKATINSSLLTRKELSKIGQMLQYGSGIQSRKQKSNIKVPRVLRDRAEQDRQAETQDIGPASKPVKSVGYSYKDLPSDPAPAKPPKRIKIDRKMLGAGLGLGAGGAMAYMMTSSPAEAREIPISDVNNPPPSPDKNPPNNSPAPIAPKAPETVNRTTPAPAAPPTPETKPKSKQVEVGKEKQKILVAYNRVPKHVDAMDSLSKTVTQNITEQARRTKQAIVDSAQDLQDAIDEGKTPTKRSNAPVKSKGRIGLGIRNNNYVGGVGGSGPGTVNSFGGGGGSSGSGGGGGGGAYTRGGNGGGSGDGRTPQGSFKDAGGQQGKASGLSQQQQLTFAAFVAAGLEGGGGHQNKVDTMVSMMNRGKQNYSGYGDLFNQLTATSQYSPVSYSLGKGNGGDPGAGRVARVANLTPEMIKEALRSPDPIGALGKLYGRSPAEIERIRTDTNGVMNSIINKDDAYTTAAKMGDKTDFRGYPGYGREQYHPGGNYFSGGRGGPAAKVDDFMTPDGKEPSAKKPVEDLNKTYTEAEFDALPDSIKGNGIDGWTSVNSNLDGPVRYGRTDAYKEAHKNDDVKPEAEDTGDPVATPYSTKAPDKLIPGDQSLIPNRVGARTDQVDPHLRSIENEAARIFMSAHPNLEVHMYGPQSGLRTSGSVANHGIQSSGFGGAQDIEIVDKTTGKRYRNAPMGTPNAMDAEGAMMYQELSNYQKAAAVHYGAPINPRWGGYFGDQAGDGMHTDVKGNWIGSSRLGDYEKGFNEQGMRMLGLRPDQNKGMGNIQSFTDSLYAPGGLANKDTTPPPIALLKKPEIRRDLIEALLGDKEETPIEKPLPPISPKSPGVARPNVLPGTEQSPLSPKPSASVKGYNAGEVGKPSPSDTPDKPAASAPAPAPSGKPVDTSSGSGNDSASSGDNTSKLKIHSDDLNDHHEHANTDVG